MIYLPPSVSGFFPRHIVFSTWMDHLSFGYDIVAALKPKTVVELGTASGLSYFVLCQSMQEHGLEGTCHAIDTWDGDEHAGFYDGSVHDIVKRHNDEHYSSFSNLLRMRFEEALPRFEDASIDLLHIDGFHTYEAVRGDFEAWLPKVRPGGVVMFHDVAAKMMDFGAWRFWGEVSSRHASFLFKHGFGLGVLRIPGGAPSEEPLLGMLFGGDPDVHERLRAFYIHAAEHQDVLRKKAAADKFRAQQQAQSAQ